MDCPRLYGIGAVEYLAKIRLLVYVRSHRVLVLTGSRGIRSLEK
jgi:hypothetical protein